MTKGSVADPVCLRNPDPGKYLILQRINRKNNLNPGLRTLGGKFQESFGLKFLVVQEKIRLFLQGSGSGSGKSIIKPKLSWNFPPRVLNPGLKSFLSLLRCYPRYLPGSGFLPKTGSATLHCRYQRLCWSPLQFSNKTITSSDSCCDFLCLVRILTTYSSPQPHFSKWYLDILYFQKDRHWLANCGHHSMH